MQMELQGRTKWGWGILTDESLEFVRNPRDFIESRTASFGPIFQARILNAPTVFVTSNAGCRELLEEKSDCFTLGYKEYFYELFNGSLPFVEGQAWESAREVLARAFSPEKGPVFLAECARIIKSYFAELDISKPVPIYKVFKELATVLCVFMFLGIEPSNPLSKEISDLMTTHWRGIISVPVSLKIPLLPVQSGYRKALGAKERLVEIIRANFGKSILSQSMCEGSSISAEEIEVNVLVYLSALIPKAFGSVLTTLVIQLSSGAQSLAEECRQSETTLRHCLYESQRMYPPLMGGFRIAKQECSLGGFRIPKGHFLGYISYFANRDRSVFDRPDHFRPQRWSNENSQDVDKLLTFGGGVRTCVGKHVAQQLLEGCAKCFLDSFTFTLVDKQDLAYKMLPISRPKADIVIHLQPFNCEQSILS